jgi:REP element-mobilizing transposase RayT
MTRRPETVAFWSGRLPHWEVVGGRYFVTIHLAGAIPVAGQERVRALAAEARQHPERDSSGRLKVHRRVFAEMERWLDRAEHVAHLREPRMADMVMAAVTFRHDRVWNMIEYVVMPSHLHLFFELPGGGLKQHVEQFKRWTGHEAARLLGVDGRRFWQDEWFDHWSRSAEEDERIVRYIRLNPVRAGLVSDYRDWPYGGWRR